MSRAIAFLLALAWAAAAGGVDTGQAFEDPATQARYERLTRELRCLVCQNESIADSSAMLAADLRREVREQIAAGRSDDEIRGFMTARYGDFVLFRPPVTPRTWLLWAAPALLLAAGLGIAGFVVLRRARVAAKEGPGPEPGA